MYCFSWFQSPQHRAESRTHQRPRRMRPPQPLRFQSPQHRGGVATTAGAGSPRGSSSCFNPLSTGAEVATLLTVLGIGLPIFVSIPSAPGRSCARRGRRRGTPSSRRVSIPSAPGRSRAHKNLKLGQIPHSMFQSPQHRGGVASKLPRRSSPVGRACVQSPEHRGGVAHAGIVLV